MPARDLSKPTRSPEAKRAAKDAVYAELARAAKALASPRRLELLDLLAQGEKSVETLAAQADLAVKNTSAQLKVLRSARLVEFRKQGQRALYRLASDDVERFWLALREFAERQYAEIREIAERFYADPDGLAPIDRASLLARARRGEVVVVDVRPADEFAAGHLPGARSIPVAELAKRIASLPKDREIVAYCRGPYCVYALEAVALLRARGFRATRLEEGVPEWRQAGLPVEAGSREREEPAARGGAAR
jgi:rhodanese-related sulfurtransferase/predicted transcriptional regulator